MTDRQRQDPSGLTRRELLSTATTAAVMGGLGSLTARVVDAQSPDPVTPSPSIIGDYGSWAAKLAADPAELSFRRADAPALEVWRAAAMSKASELIASPDIDLVGDVTTVRKAEVDGLTLEELQWQLPYGRPTKAILLKPAGVSKRLPGILALHDHGGNKYFGKRKIARTDQPQHPLMEQHQADYYSGKAWANEIARRGFVVLVHDAYAFASRRVLFSEMKAIPWGDSRTDGRSDDDPENSDNIRAYNEWASSHENVMAKSLFSAGTTWPGVFLAEDRAALSVLIDREDVDGDRVGCGGLSGGGLRTAYLGGLDHRIKCAVCVGFMSTWRDFLFSKSYTHTWMTYAPLLPKFLDFPELLGLRVPLPTLVQNDIDDSLYTLPEMKRADQMLADVYAKAGAAQRYQGKFYPGDHKFDTEMQHDAFNWFDRWLKS